MARKQTPPPPEPEPELLISREEAEGKIKNEIQRGTDLIKRIESEKDIEGFKSDYNRWTSYTMELLSRIFTTKAIAKEFDLWYVEEGSITWVNEPSYSSPFKAIKKI